jgi:hypothetical protein
MTITSGVGQYLSQKFDGYKAIFNLNGSKTSNDIGY